MMVVVVYQRESSNDSRMVLLLIKWEGKYSNSPVALQSPSLLLEFGKREVEPSYPVSSV